MNPQDFTRDQAINPNTPIEVLTQIAQTRADLLPALATNPAIPQDMANWLSSLNNPEIAAALAHRGNMQMPPAPSFAQAPVPPAPLQQGSYSLPSQPQSTLQSDAWATAGTTPVGRKKSKRGLIIGGIVAAVAVVGGGAWAANHFLFAKLGGAESPQAAVEKLIQGFEDQDMVSVYGSISPVETEWMSANAQTFTKHFDGQLDFSKVGDEGTNLAEAFSLTSTDVTYEVEDINDDFARVKIATGDFVLDADPKLLSDAAIGLLGSLKGTYFEELVTETGGSFPTDAEIEEGITDGIAETFPVEFTAQDMTIDFDSISQLLMADPMALGMGGGDLLDGLEETDPEPLYLVVSKEGGNWFVSPTLTVADIQAKVMGAETDYDRIKEVTYADTPEEAGANLVAGTARMLTELDTSGYYQYLVEAERRGAIAVQELPFSDYELEEFKALTSQINISEAKFSVDKTEGDRAYLKLDSLAISGEIEGTSVAVTLASDCTSISADAMDMDLCFRDIPAAQELGLDKLRLVAVKEDGGWVIGGSESSMDGLGILASNALRLAKEGHLTDSQWWIDNSGVLQSYLGL